MNCHNRIYHCKNPNNNSSCNKTICYGTWKTTKLCHACAGISKFKLILTKKFLEEQYSIKSTVKIAKEVGCRATTINNYLKKYGIKIHSSVGANNTLKKHRAKIAQKKWRNKNKKDRPWYDSYYNAKQRCTNKNNKNYPWYGSKGIKFLLSMEECAGIWKRDGADNMDFPTIDRINNKGNYEYSNCQFLEHLDNSIKDNKGHMFEGRYIKYYKIEQLDNNKDVVKIWNSQGEISRTLNIDQGEISRAIKYKQRRYGFYWKNIN